jgi:glycine cleavage system H protein
VLIGSCRFADDVLYDVGSDTWARFEDDGTATIGVDTILIWLAGRLEKVSFKPVGTIIEKGKSLGSIEGPRHFDTVKSPITGRILKVNGALSATPGLLDRDPYGEGWFAVLQPLRREEELAWVKPASLSREALASRIAELNVRCFAEFPDYEMYEIGTECSAVLVRLDESLAGSQPGTVVHIVSDDPSSELEMIRWSDRTGNQVLETRREGNLVHYIVKKS